MRLCKINCSALIQECLRMIHKTKSWKVSAYDSDRPAAPASNLSLSSTNRHAKMVTRLAATSQYEASTRLACQRRWNVRILVLMALNMLSVKRAASAYARIVDMPISTCQHENYINGNDLPLSASLNPTRTGDLVTESTRLISRDVTLYKAPTPA